MTVITKRKGNFLEHFRVGHVFRHKVGKTITEGLMNAFTEFDMTTNPLSKNRRYAERYGFRGLVVPPGRDLGQLVLVLAAVVSAEEQLTAGGHVDSDVGLRATAVTTVGRGELVRVLQVGNSAVICSN